MMNKNLEKLADKGLKNRQESQGQQEAHEEDSRAGPRPAPSKESLAEGLEPDAGKKHQTPGRPKSGSSRQQTQPGQRDAPAATPAAKPTRK